MAATKALLLAQIEALRGRLREAQEEQDRLQGWAIAWGWMWSKAEVGRVAAIERAEAAEAKLCSTCGGSGKVWETGCEATEYLNWTVCPDCDSGRLILAERDAAEQRALVGRCRRAAQWWSALDAYGGSEWSDEVEAACLAIYGECAEVLCSLLTPAEAQERKEGK